MNLIISDHPLVLTEKQEHSFEYIDLTKQNMHNCVGCFGCWTKTIGKCVIRDDAVKIYPLIAKSERALYVSKLAYGGYDLPMKTLLERSIPIQQAFIRLHEGETHHVQRAVVAKDATIIAYGDISKREVSIFQKLVARNAKNMSFKNYKVLFVPEEKVNDIVSKEVEQWKKYG